MSSSLSVSRERSLRSRSSRTAGMPAGSIAAMSQPEPLTHSTSTVSPSRSGMRGLDRGVAAAMQHEPRIAAEQAACCRRAAPDRAPRLASHSERSSPALRFRPNRSPSPAPVRDHVRASEGRPGEAQSFAQRPLRPPAGPPRAVLFGGRGHYHRRRRHRRRGMGSGDAIAGKRRDRHRLPHGGTPSRRLRRRSWLWRLGGRRWRFSALLGRRLMRCEGRGLRR